MEEGSSTRLALYAFSPLSTVTLCKEYSCRLCNRWPLFPNGNSTHSQVIQKIFHISVNHLAICKVAHTFPKVCYVPVIPPLTPAGGLCLGARKRHGLGEEPCIPGGPWVRGWGHAVLSIWSDCLLVTGQSWIISSDRKGVQRKLLMPPEDVGWIASSASHIIQVPTQTWQQVSGNFCFKGKQEDKVLIMK